MSLTHFVYLISMKLKISLLLVLSTLGAYSHAQGISDFNRNGFDNAHNGADSVDEQRGGAFGSDSSAESGGARAAAASRRNQAKFKRDEAAIARQAAQDVSQMSQSDKVAEMSGTGSWDFKAIDQFGLPEVQGADGGGGIRYSSPEGVGFPAGPALASTWSIERAKEFGIALGHETYLKGYQQVTGPGMNLYRMPYSGRAFEYLSGEDPFIGAELAPAMINGIQSQGVWADAKHFVANEQEADRFNMTETISERALRELYLVPFESAVKNANVASVMCTFVGVNTSHPACENEHLVQDVLKNEWGFKGVVETDYGVLDNTLLAANAGVDVEKLNADYFTLDNLAPYLADGEITQATIDDKVKRVVGRILAYNFENAISKVNHTEDDAGDERASLDVAREGIVLLKNKDQLLPLHRGRIKRIAVIGQAAHDAPPTGGGSGHVDAVHWVAEVDGIRNQNPGAKVDFISAMSLVPLDAAWTTTDSNGQSVQGLTGEYFANDTLSGTPTATRVDREVQLDASDSTNLPSGISSTFSARWTGSVTPTITGDTVFKARANGAVRIYVNGVKVVDNGDGDTLPDNAIPPTIPVSGKIHLEAGKTYSVKVEYEERSGYISSLGNWYGVQLSWASIAPNPELVKYDAVVVAVGNSNETEGEGFDHGFEMPDFENELVKNVARSNPNTIVVVHGGTAVDMSKWVDDVPAVIEAWYPGQNGGQALGEILYGDVNPSGKLPITIDRHIEDNPSYASYPVYRNDTSYNAMTYSEGLFLGYRGYDRDHKKPLFPFGFGLSYTTFRYSDLHVTPGVAVGDTPVKVTFNITNTGHRAGAESAQLYVSPSQPDASHPIRELEGFGKVFLQPGETRQMTIMLNKRSLAYYDVSSKDWKVDAGTYPIEVGASSADIRLHGAVTNLTPDHLSTKTSNPLADPQAVLVQTTPHL